MPILPKVRACQRVGAVLIAAIGLLGAALLAAQGTGAAKSAGHPDFGPNVQVFGPLGPNVLIFGPSTPSADIQAQIDEVYAIEQHSEFGSARYALLFLPGEYHVDIPVGFYTQV